MKLRQQNLPQLQAQAIATPRYDRSSSKPGIVHLGVGSFHRAHQAWYTEAVMNESGGDWRIIGVSLRRPDMRDKLQPQDCLYSLVTRQNDKADYQVIGAFSEILVAPENPEAVINALAHPDIHVVTLTITEKGYGLNAASGQLDLSQSEIAQDIEGDKPPRTALGFLAKALARRRDNGLPGLTIISCDNLSENGHKLRTALLQFSTHKDAQLSDWIALHCTFPNTMVDRIVPATTPGDVSQFAHDFGIDDAAPVFTETFSQWVIEKNFAGPVPPWDKVGAQFVEDVAPFEALKLRTLNASHSLIAYMGCITGKETVAEAIAEPSIRRAVEGLMREEAQPGLNLPEYFSVENYQRALLDRFDNTALNHRCAQIAMDGSQKIPQRVVPIIASQLERDGSIRYATLAIAAWLYYLRGETPSPIEDPLKEKLALLWRGDKAHAVDSILSMREIFPIELGEEPQVRSSVLTWLELIAEGNICETMNGG